MVYLVESRCSSAASDAGPGSRLRSDGPAGSRRLACTGEPRENSLATRVRTAPADFSRPRGASRRILKVAGCQGRRPMLRVARVARLRRCVCVAEFWCVAEICCDDDKVMAAFLWDYSI